MKQVLTTIAVSVATSTVVCLLMLRFKIPDTSGAVSRQEFDDLKGRAILDSQNVRIHFYQTEDVMTRIPVPDDGVSVRKRSGTNELWTLKALRE